jgi:pantoate--beta-alanine ligase
MAEWVENASKKRFFELEYFQIADETSLLPCLRKKNQNISGLYSGSCRNIRLIDTISLN